MTRLTASFRVSAMRRFVDQQGGFAVILKRGDEMSGDIMLILLERGENAELFSRQLGADGEYRWGPVLIKNQENQYIKEYIARAIARDPDLWVIELDIASKAPFVEWLGTIN